MFESIILPAIVSLTTASIFLLFRSYLANREQNKNELRQRSKESFQKLLEWHSKLFIGFRVDQNVLDKEHLKDQIHTGRQIALWGSDEVIFHYSRAYKILAGDSFPPLSEYEMELGESVLAFRKNELNFSNKKLTSEHIITLLRGGYTVNLS